MTRGHRVNVRYAQFHAEVLHLQYLQLRRWLSALQCDFGMFCFICRRWDALTERQMENRSCQLMELIKMKYHEPADTSRRDKHTVTPCGDNYITADGKSLHRWGAFVTIPLWWQGRGFPLDFSFKEENPIRIGVNLSSFSTKTNSAQDCMFCMLYVHRLKPH